MAKHESIYSAPSRLKASLFDALKVEAADALAKLRTEAVALVTAGEAAATARAERDGKAGGAWEAVAKVTEAALELDAGQELDGAAIADVVRALVTDALDNEPAAVKTVKAYTGLAARVAVAVRDGAKPVTVLHGEEGYAPHGDVRKALATDEWADLQHLHKELAGLLADIRGRENDRVSFATRTEALRELLAAVRPVRDGIVTTRDGLNPRSKAAAAAADVRQEAPANAATLETIAA